jgi:protocatechuate 3,4-dioxygenase beta subunit
MNGDATKDLGMHDHEELHDHDRGLSYDLPRLLSRRRALTLFGGAGLAAFTLACAADSSPSTTGTAAAAQPRSAPPGGDTSGTTATATEEIPQETAGPFPADGSNGINLLTESGVVRSDITASFGGASGVAHGVPLNVELTILDLSGGRSTPLAGAAVYIWHCTADGEYSLYSRRIANENYLRGVQEADANGNLRFTSIYPGAYSGRWPHIHFEVYPSLAAATSASDKLRTSQIALPEDASRLVYATDAYGNSLDNLAGTSLERDMVFRDGYSLQMATVTGNVESGMTAKLTVPV